MADLNLQCPTCGHIITYMELPPGTENVRITGCTQQCPKCGTVHNVPDGSFSVTPSDVLQILLSYENPLWEARYILEELKKIKTQEEFDQKIKSDEELKKHKKWLPKDFKDLAEIIKILLIVIPLLLTQKGKQAVNNPTIINNYYYNDRNPQTEYFQEEKLDEDTTSYEIENLKNIGEPDIKKDSANIGATSTHSQKSKHKKRKKRNPKPRKKWKK